MPARGYGQVATGNYSLVWLSLIVALWLSIVPLPTWLLWSRPEWVGLVLIYWAIVWPERVGIGTAWLAGLLLDLVEGAPLGQQALTLSIVMYCVLNSYRRLRVFCLWQQAMAVWALLMLKWLLDHWVSLLVSAAPLSWWSLWPVLVSALLWPIGFRVVDRF